MAPNGREVSASTRVNWPHVSEGEFKKMTDEATEARETTASIPSRSKKSEPFGDETHAEVKYRTMHWWQAGIIMVAETISIGILSLPSALAAVGFVPGIILLLALGVVASYTGYTLGQFKLAYPHVHNMADAGEVLGGPILREIFGVSQIIFFVFVMGSHILTFSIMMNVLTDHGTCTIVFGVVGMILCTVCTLPRTLKKVSLLAIFSWISIFAAILVTMIGIGIEKPGSGKVAATIKTSLPGGFLAVSNIIFAYAGHVTFFTFISELHTPSHYPKALLLLQAIDMSTYLITAVVIYYYTAPTTASPALSTLPPKLRKIAYGIAIPTIVVSGVINAHVAAKFIFVRLFRGTDRMGRRSWSSFGIWLGLVGGLWLLAWLIAEGIPNFNNLLGLISPLFCSWFTYGLSGVFWLFLNKGRYRESARKMVLTGVNLMIFLMGGAICALGLFASGMAIHAGRRKPFSCADTS